MLYYLALIVFALGIGLGLARCVLAFQERIIRLINKIDDKLDEMILQ